MTTSSGPAWDLSTEYASPDDPAINVDLAELARLLGEVEGKNAALVDAVSRTFEFEDGQRSHAIAAARAIHATGEEAIRLLANPGTYAHCCLSVDGEDAAALALKGRLQSLEVRFRTAMEPLSQFLDLAPDDLIDEYLDADRVRPSAFAVQHSRRRRHELLSLREENLVSALGQDGIHAWERLYDKLAGTLKCRLGSDGNKGEEVGLAQATLRMMSPDDAVREDAWRAINRTWDEHAQSGAAAINAIAGWRLEMCRQRSRQRPVHYLDAPVHVNRIERRTLETLMAVAWESNALARRAAKAMARAYRKQSIGPWDQRAPAPSLPGSPQAISFGDAIDLVAGAYGSVHPDMGNFVRMMARNRWIEATLGPRKMPGAYCTSFAKSRAPRVYMTFGGSMTDVAILAHELGHGFHHWVMRDLPDAQRHYGMSVAETASIFGETVVRDALMRKASSPAEELAVAWEEVASTVGFLLNIPTRYEFETRFYDARAERPLLPDELKTLMSDAWTRWHGDALSEPDPLFWVSKLHFYISELPFYNFPYLFGYLFSLGVYARREQMGDGFFERYKALLADTGRMSTEELAATHLDADITEPGFWRETVAAMEPRIENFERLVAATVEAPDA